MVPGDELVLGQVPQAVALARLEDDAGAADELGDDDALGAVDDERSLVGHHREVAHEHRLFLDLTGVLVHEPGAHEDRRAVGHVLLLALLHRELGRRAQVLVVGVELQLEHQGLAEVLDGADVAEGLRQPLLEEPLERLALDGDQIRQREGLGQVRERIALTGATSRQGSSPAGGRAARTPAARKTGGRARRGTAKGDPTGRTRPESTRVSRGAAAFGEP